MRRVTAVRHGASKVRGLAAAALIAVLLSLVAGQGVASASDYHIDINITEQLLSEVVDGQVVWSTHISTGNGEAYWYEGEWWLAETPRGWFQIYAKDAGWQEGSLGWMYSPMYFVGGFAIHGSASVPDYPASHGCVRVPLDVTDYLFDRIPIGTWVDVHD
jgi:lipoprotein-anchoring transpeptidase ErfK/SrfK